MTPLERLGFEVAAGRLLETHNGVGRLLRILVERPDRATPAGTLAELVGVANAETVRTYACLLRSGLKDIGITARIVCSRGEYRFEGSPEAVMKAVQGAAQ